MDNPDFIGMLMDEFYTEGGIMLKFNIMAIAVGAVGAILILWRHLADKRAADRARLRERLLRICEEVNICRR